MKTARWGAVLMSLILTACTTFSSAVSPAPVPARDPLPKGLTVFAAASLTEFITAAADAFTAAHPEAPVTVELAGSQQLARQLADGARADVYAPADQRWMDEIADAGMVDGAARAFAANRMEIAVEPGNPRGIAGLGDLTRPGLTVVKAAPAVPAGRYAAKALHRAGVELHPASLELDVRAALARVVMGEADAAIVYHTDVVAADGQVEGVALPDRHAVAVRYPVAVLRDAPNRPAALAFVNHLMEADQLREKFGFLSP